MTEDVQPNERPGNRKGSAIPVVRPTRVNSRGHYGSYGMHYQRSPNYSQSGTHFTSPSNHRQHFYPKRPQIFHDAPSSKRRHTEQDLDSRFKPPSYPPPRPPSKPRTHNSQAELMVELPSHCRKGSPDCHRLRREWQALRLQELSVETGISFRLAGYNHNTARFVANNSKEAGDYRPNQDIPPPALMPTEPHVALLSETSSKSMFDEVVIADDSSTSISPSSLKCLINLSSHRPSPFELTDKQTPGAYKRFPMFRSGVLSISPKDSCRRSSSSGQAGSVIVSEGAWTLPMSSDSVACPLEKKEALASAKLHVAMEHGSPSLHPPIQTSYNYCDSDNSYHSPNHCTLTSEDVTIRIPLRPTDKIRRLMHLDGSSIVSASMRSSVDLFAIETLRHQRFFKSPKLEGLVDDACMVKAGDDYLVIFGHARDQEQLSWCYSQPTNQGQVRFLARPWNSVKKGGVSAVTTMMHPMQFATGGYDHAVHLWDIKPDISDASPRLLAIKHTSQIQSLLSIRDTSHKLLSAGADCNVRIWDLSSERVVNTLKPSNATYHLHATTSPFCTLLEVAHRELQFEVRDHRLVPQHPVLRFGYSTDKVHGRFIKGAASSQMFACGSRDGYIRLWDMRNMKSPANTTASCHGQKIVQVIFEKGHLIACAETGQTSLFRYGMEFGG